MSTTAIIVQTFVFTGTVAGVLAVIQLIKQRQKPTDKRFEEILETLSVVAEKPAAEEDALLNRASRVLSVPFTPRSEAEVGWLKRDLVAAGFQSIGAIATYSTIRFITFVAAAIISSTAGAILRLDGNLQLALLLVGMVVGMYLPRFVLKSLGKRRQKRILRALPDVLDLLVICIDSGQALDAALRKILDRLPSTANELASEFRTYLNQLNMGMARREALHALGARSGVSELNSLAAVLNQADRFGTSIVESLRDLSEAIRIRRRHAAEERAQKTAVKLIFPLVLFLFPGIFAVLVGPAAITLYRDFVGG